MIPSTHPRYNRLQRPCLLKPPNTRDSKNKPLHAHSGRAIAVQVLTEVMAVGDRATKTKLTPLTIGFGVMGASDGKVGIGY
ncbi:hypothetical protein SD81_028170 [Tolypothrix campylonemoides VB511288]|nr:hypothetical protein SD81_028170 [Tolypothrix campylonemoides VB511288]